MTANTEAFRRHTVLIVVLLASVLAAAALRLINLGGASLWEDELFSADLVLERPLIPPADVPWLERIHIHGLTIDGRESFWTVKAADQSPPMFELAAKLATSLFGPGEASLRLPSALASALVLAWLAWRTWRARGNPRMPAYLAMLVLSAFSGIMVFYAREARGYALGAALTTVLAVLFWDRCVTGWRQATLPRWGEIAICVAACMTHYNALVLTGLLLLPCTWEAVRRRDWAALGRQLVVAAVVAGWLAFSFTSIKMAAEGGVGWTSPTSTAIATETLLIRFYGFIIGPWLAPVLLLLLAATALAVWHRTPPESIAVAELRRGARWSAGVFSLALGLAIYVASKSQILHPRHLIFALPVLYMFLATCVALLALRWRALAWLLVLLITAAQAVYVRNALTALSAEFRSAGAFLVERLQAGDALITTPLLNPAAFNYYLHQTDKRFDRYILDTPEDALRLCDYLARYQRIGFYGHGDSLPKAVVMRDLCGNRYTIDFYLRHNVFAAVWTRN